MDFFVYLQAHPEGQGDDSGGNAGVQEDRGEHQDPVKC